MKDISTSLIKIANLTASIVKEIEEEDEKY